MRNQTLLILATVAALAGPRAHAAEEQGAIRLTALGAMERRSALGWPETNGSRSRSSSPRRTNTSR